MKKPHLVSLSLLICPLYFLNSAFAQGAPYCGEEKHLNRAPYSDDIVLHNPTNKTVQIAYRYRSDAGMNYFPGKTVLKPHESYVVSSVPGIMKSPSCVIDSIIDVH